MTSTVDPSAETTGVEATLPAEMKLMGSQGPLLVALHGFGSDRNSWLTLESFLLARGRLLTMDLPGHGRRATDVGDGRLSTLAEATAHRLAALGDEPWHLIGHSLGGGLALYLADRFPERVASLTLIAPVGLGQGVNADFLSSFPQIQDAAQAQALLQQLVQQPRLIGRSLSAGLAASLHEPGRRSALQAIAQGIRQFEQHDMEALLARPHLQTIPRLVLWGDADRINTPDLTRIARFGGEFHTIDNAGHLPHIEQIRAVQERVGEFLNQVGLSAA
jgi:pimeloyl-ACP methyl ester carboxylesterase